MQTAAEVLAGLLEERAAGLSALATRLRRYEANDVFPLRRLMALAGPLLVLLADIEHAAHTLARFLPSEVAPGGEGGV